MMTRPPTLFLILTPTTTLNQSFSPQRMDENSRVLTGEYNSISQALSTLVEQYLDKPHCLAFPNIKTFPQDKVSPETSNDGIITL